MDSSIQTIQKILERMLIDYMIYILNQTNLQ